MPYILLIRHGENSYVGKRLAGRLPDVHLNEHGRQQAEQIAATLAGAPIGAIYSSPQDRAVETAQPLAEQLKLPIQIMEGLSEIDFGEWQGRSLKQLRRFKLWKTVQKNPASMRFPGGESFLEAQQRLVKAVDEITAAHEKEDLIVCTSHSDSIKLLVCHYLGMPLDNFQRLSIDTTSITAMFLGGDQPHLVHINQIIPFTLQLPEKKVSKIEKQPEDTV